MGFLFCLWWCTKGILISKLTFALTLTTSCLRAVFLKSLYIHIQMFRLTFIPYRLLMMLFLFLKPNYEIHQQPSPCSINILW